LDIDLYTFDELSEDLKTKVINQHIDTLIEVVDFESLNHNSNMYKAYRESEKMQTPWFIGEYIWDYCKKQIQEDVRAFEYYDNGEIFDELVNN